MSPAAHPEAAQPAAQSEAPRTLVERVVDNGVAVIWIAVVVCLGVAMVARTRSIEHAALARRADYNARVRSSAALGVVRDDALTCLYGARYACDTSLRRAARDCRYEPPTEEPWCLAFLVNQTMQSLHAIGALSNYALDHVARAHVIVTCAARRADDADIERRLLALPSRALDAVVVATRDVASLFNCSDAQARRAAPWLRRALAFALRLGVESDSASDTMTVVFA